MCGAASTDEAFFVPDATWSEQSHKFSCTLILLSIASIIFVGAIITKGTEVVWFDLVTCQHKENLSPHGNTLCASGTLLRPNPWSEKEGEEEYNNISLYDEAGMRKTKNLVCTIFSQNRPQN